MRLQAGASAVMLSLLTATAAIAQTTALDRPRRNAGVAWPKGFDPMKADAFNHNELLIEASCDRVYRRLAAPASWPDWLTIATDVRGAVPGRTPGAGSRFSWKIFGNAVTSVVYVAEPGRRLGYTNTPPGPPPSYAQSWLLTPRVSKCLVTTEEIGMGEPARAATAGRDIRVHVAYDLWLASLRWASIFGAPIG